jgi:tight adherence protein C
VALASLFWAGFAFLIARAALNVLAAPRLRILQGLAAAGEAGARESEELLDLPFSRRVLLPAFRTVGRALSRLLPRRILAETGTMLARAGLPRHRPSDWLGAQALLGVAAAGYGLLLARGHGAAALLALAGLPVGWMLPRLYLRSRASRRHNRIRDDLPDALDLLTVCVEAGLGFDQAMVRVVERFAGPLGEEFARALRDQRLGTPRREALLGVVERSDVPELATFVHAVLQAEELGVRIGGVLRVQADAMRERRRQHAEEQAMKAPIKMAFPMIFLILPALFLVVLGPAVIDAVRALQGGP